MGDGNESGGVDEDEMDGEEVSAFATWLLEARKKKGWTQKQLSIQSGISQPQISMLETGRTRNPQVDTRQRLETALGEKMPAEVVEKEASENEIPGLGSLTTFDPYKPEMLPNVTGVYVFYDKTKRPVYVGRATKRTIAQRVPEHMDKFWFRPPVVSSAYYLEITKEELCKQTEQVLIKFLRTHLLLNKQGVEVDADDDG